MEGQSCPVSTNSFGVDSEYSGLACVAKAGRGGNMWDAVVHKAGNPGGHRVAASERLASLRSSSV